MIHATLIVIAILASASIVLSAYALWKAPTVLQRLRLLPALLIASALVASATLRLIAPDNAIAGYGSVVYMIGVAVVSLFLLYWTQRQGDGHGR